MSAPADRVGGLLAEAGLAADDELGVVLSELRALGQGPPPVPSDELAALLSGTGPVSQTEPATRLRPLRRRVVGGAGALAVTIVAATGVAAAANELPSGAQLIAARISERILPFRFPRPAGLRVRGASAGTLSLPAPDSPGQAPDGDRRSSGIGAWRPPRTVAGDGPQHQAARAWADHERARDGWADDRDAGRLRTGDRYAGRDSGSDAWSGDRESGGGDRDATRSADDGRDGSPDTSYDAERDDGSRDGLSNDGSTYDGDGGSRDGGDSYDGSGDGSPDGGR